MMLADLEHVLLALSVDAKHVQARIAALHARQDLPELLVEHAHLAPPLLLAQLQLDHSGTREP
jgi:hypothetical protein